MITYSIIDMEVEGSHVVARFCSAKSSASICLITTVKDFRDSLNKSLRSDVSNPYFHCSGIRFCLDGSRVRELVLLFNFLTK